MDAKILQDLVKNVGKIDLPKGKPKVMSVEIEKIGKAPIEGGEIEGDQWPVVKEALQAARSQLDSLEDTIRGAYYPGEKENSEEIKEEVREY